MEGRLTFNSSYPMIEAAARGHGVAYAPEDIVSGEIASGALVVILDAWSPKFPGYFLYSPSSRQNSPAFQALVEALRRREP